jgi:hypothetical protein
MFFEVLSGMDLLPNNQNFDLNFDLYNYAREIDTAFWKKYQFPGRVIQNDWKTANFAGLYYPHLTTFLNETSEYY